MGRSAPSSIHVTDWGWLPSLEVSGPSFGYRLHAFLVIFSLLQPMLFAKLDVGLLFVALTYLTFICFELSTPIRFHYVQYGVVGLGLVLFYLALLSLSEHMSFIGAYLIATGLLTALISWYVHVMSRSRRLALVVFGVILSLYVVLYTLLKLEAFSLLAGTGLLLVGLGALMYATRGLGELEHDAANDAPAMP